MGTQTDLARNLGSVDKAKLAYSIKEAAEMLSISPLTVKRLAYKGKLKTSKIGSRRVVHASDLERLLKRTQE